MCQISKITLILLLFLQNSSFAQEDKDDILLGKYRKIYSKVLNEERTILIKLPEGYNDSEKEYPVLFQLDGDKVLFLRSTGTIAFLSEWRHNIPEMIVVSIPNTDRNRDMFPVYLPGVSNANADNFLKFFSDELIPFVEENYRTSHYRILIGYSNSALFTVYSLLAKPDIFSAYIASSPSLGHCKEFIFEKAESIFKEQTLFNKFLFMTDGKQDHFERLMEPIPAFKELLEEKAPKDLQWKLKVFEEEGHCPPTSLYDGLITIFSDWSISDTIAESGVKAIKNHLKALKEKYGITKSEEPLFNYLGRKYWSQQKYEEAIEMYSQLLETDADSSEILLSIGLIYIESEQYKNAFKALETSVKVNPNKMGSIYQIGRTAALSGTNHDRGIECLRMYLNHKPEARNPGLDSAHWRLGMIYEKKGNKALARKEYEAALQIAPDNDEYKKALTRLK